jgi:FSR family fosmidomycin resistance protein-like MFS transporter
LGDWSMEKPLWMIYTTHMFVEIHLLIQVALIPVIVREFRLSLLEASLVATVPSFVALLMNLPSGILADRVSTNRLLFASMLVEGIAAFLVSQTSDFWPLVLAVSLLRVSSPIYHVSGLSQISRMAKPERMSRSIGFHNALGNVGSAAGVISLTLFLWTLGWRWTYLFWSVPVLAWGFVILMSPHLKTCRVERTESPERGGLRRLPLVFSSALLLFLIFIGLREVGFTGSTTFMTTFFVQTRGISETMASLIFGLGPFIGIVGSLYGGFWAERVGAKKSLSWAVLLCAMALSLLALASELHLIILIYVFYSFFGSTVWAPINTLVARLTPTSDRGLSYSVYFFSEGLLIAVAPTLAAGVIELTNVWFVLPFSIVFLVASVIILHFLPAHKHSENSQSS